MQRIYHTAKLYIIVKHGRASLLPHFATGYHAFGLKIATAALRPRNDRKTVGFFIKPTVFVFTMFEICRGATPPRRFPGSAISRGRKPAFHMRSIFHPTQSVGFHCGLARRQAAYSTFIIRYPIPICVWIYCGEFGSDSSFLRSDAMKTRRDATSLSQLLPQIFWVIKV